LSAIDGTVLWNGAPIAVQSASGTAAFPTLLASTTKTDSLLSDNATFTNVYSYSLASIILNSAISMINSLSFISATGTSVQAGDIYTTNFTATGTSNFQGVVSVGATTTNLFAGSATFLQLETSNFSTQNFSVSGFMGALGKVELGTSDNLINLFGTGDSNTNGRM
jgi:hypothetical protein